MFALGKFLTSKQGILGIFTISSPRGRARTAQWSGVASSASICGTFPERQRKMLGAGAVEAQGLPDGEATRAQVLATNGAVDRIYFSAAPWRVRRENNRPAP